MKRLGEPEEIGNFVGGIIQNKIKGKEKGQRDTAKMTFKEFEKWRESQGAKRF